MPFCIQPGALMSDTLKASPSGVGVAGVEGVGAGVGGVEGLGAGVGDEAAIGVVGPQFQSSHDTR